MNTDDALLAEFFVVIAINGWGAIRAGYWPWPPTIVRCCVAIAILNLLAMVSGELAVVLGAGFLLALILANMQSAPGGTKLTDIFGAVPPTGITYDVLTIPGMSQAQ